MAFEQYSRGSWPTDARVARKEFWSATNTTTVPAGGTAQLGLNVVPQLPVDWGVMIRQASMVMFDASFPSSRQLRCLSLYSNLTYYSDPTTFLFFPVIASAFSAPGEIGSAGFGVALMTPWEIPRDLPLVSNNPGFLQGTLRLFDANVAGDVDNIDAANPHDVSLVGYFELWWYQPQGAGGVS